MKIALLSLYSGHVNRGVERWTSDIANQFVKLGNDVLVIQGGKENGPQKFQIKEINMFIKWNISAKSKILRQVISWWYFNLINYLFTFRSVITLMSFRPDIVIPSNGGIQTLLIRIFSILFKWKMVVVAHAGIGASDKWNLLMRADLYIFPSKCALLWARALKYSKNLNMVTIPHGIDLNKFKKINNNFEISLPKPIYLVVSSDDPYKRLDLAVNAVSKLSTGSLLIIGGEDTFSKTDKLAIQKLGPSRYLRCRANPDDMPAYYSAANVFTLPSMSTEAFGIVYLEAMACGLPVVATNDELRREIIEKAGILVDPQDLDTYSNALTRASSRKWGNVPRKQALKFSWKFIAAKYISEFNKQINK